MKRNLEGNNVSIRKALHDCGAFQWELANWLEIDETKLCKMLREELPEETQKQWIEIIMSKGAKK